MNLKTLNDIHEIETLKSRYFRYLDLKMWTEWRQIFTDDLQVFIEDEAVPTATEPTIRSADALVAYQAAADPRKVTVHQGHMPEIEFTGKDEATGIWAMFDWVDDPGRGLALQGYGHYHDTYRRGVDGVWRISSLRLTRLRTSDIAPQTEDFRVDMDHKVLDQVVDHLESGTS
jgi:hypothetical protein